MKDFCAVTLEADRLAVLCRIVGGRLTYGRPQLRRQDERVVGSLNRNVRRVEKSVTSVRRAAVNVGTWLD